jgi:ketosteroid isomerase-like protein
VPSATAKPSAPDDGVESLGRLALDDAVTPDDRAAPGDEVTAEDEVASRQGAGRKDNVGLGARVVAATAAERITAEIVALERAALDRWGAGDPSGFLEICAPDVVYFDPFLDLRIDGLEALTIYYEAIRGQIKIDRYELLNPKVQGMGRMAVLTFNYVSYGGNENKFRWNCTEAYRKDPAGWRIIQTHWSFTNPTK